VSERLTVERVWGTAYAFAREHGVDPLGAGAEVEIGPPRAAGGFGTVHELVSIDGVPPRTPLLLKVFADDRLAQLGGPSKIVERVTALQRLTERQADQGWIHDLLALPLAVASVELRGGSELATIMLDLSARGYEPLPFGSPAAAVAYRGRDFPERLEVALAFARRAALLAELGFLHGDLNRENVLVDLARLDVQIIDLDTGAVLATGAERPLTPGKLDDCMPPEVKGTPAAMGLDLDRYTAAAERWSVGTLLGVLLLGLAHPGFFLRAISPRTIDAYARQPVRWPDIDTSSDEFTTIEQNRAAYRNLKPELDALADGVREQFARFFDAGLDGDARPTAEEWAAALDALRQPPVFDLVAVDRDLAVEGEEITVTWVARNASHVENDRLGTLPAAGAAPIVVDRSGRVELTAVNPYGRATGCSEVVRVVALPRLDSVPVARFPGLSIVATVTTPALPPTPLRELAPPAHVATPRLVPPLDVGRLVPQPPIPPVPPLSSLLAAPHADHSATRRTR
jgi:Phosphotransferase enzyme family